MIVVSLASRRVVSGLMSQVCTRCRTQRTWVLLGWRAAGHDASTSMGVVAPLIVGAGFLGIFLGFVDVANGYARLVHAPGSLARNEALILLLPAASVTLVGHCATLVVLARRRARTMELLRSAGATERELTVSSVLAGLVSTASALVVACVTVGIFDVLYLLTARSVVAELPAVLIPSLFGIGLFCVASLLSSVVGSLAGVWASDRDGIAVASSQR